jgi:hypothetical protein
MILSGLEQAHAENRTKFVGIRQFLPSKGYCPEIFFHWCDFIGILPAILAQ